MALAFAIPLGLALVMVPAAIRVATRVGFYDEPRGYKAHGRSTPYLGGAALLAAFLPGAILLGNGSGKLATIVAGASALSIVGTVDDRRLVPPAWRVAAEVGAAVVLWQADIGWSAFASDQANLALTILWVVGVVNAFNLMDNLDGAAASVALAAAAGVAALAVGADYIALGALALGVCGVTAAFLRYNLASPARIFLGDGGSMWLGFAIAAAVMAVPPSEPDGWSRVCIGLLVVGLPALDTTLVVISRTRRGISVLTGGRDHLSHRLLARLGSPRKVALALGGAQAALCAGAIVLASLDGPDATGVSAACIAAGLLAVLLLDTPRWRPPEPTPAPARHAELRGESVVVGLTESPTTSGASDRS